MINQHLNNTYRQQGGATLFMAMSILVLMTLVLFFAARTMQLEVKVISNYTRNIQAFEAAEAGVAHAVSNFEGNEIYCLKNVTDTSCDSAVNLDMDAVDTSATDNLSASFYLEVDADGGVVSRGFSDDKSATRVIRIRLDNVDPLPNPPDNPLISQGTSVFTGSATVYNPEGHTTIWSGDKTDLTQNNSASTFIADPSFDDGTNSYPTCMDYAVTCHMLRSSNKVNSGLDVIEHDESLVQLQADGSLAGLSANPASTFFGNFMGASKQDFFDNRATIVVDASSGGAIESVKELTGEVIWIHTNDTNGDGYGDGVVSLSGSPTFGCSVDVNGVNADNNGGYLPGNTCPDVEPSMYIIDGDLDVGGSPAFYGLLFVTGDLIGGGNFSVEGSIVVEGDAKPTGSIDVWYNSDMLEALTEIGNYSGIAGTWRDF